MAAKGYKLEIIGQIGPLRNPQIPGQPLRGLPLTMKAVAFRGGDETLYPEPSVTFSEHSDETKGFTMPLNHISIIKCCRILKNHHLPACFENVLEFTYSSVVPRGRYSN